KCRVIPADRQQSRHIEPQKRDHDVFEILWICRWIRSRNTDVGAASEVDAADGVNRQWSDMLDVTLHQPVKPIAHANDVHAFQCGTNCGSADHGIYTWGRSAPNQDCKFFMMFHISMIRHSENRRLTEAYWRLQPRSGEVANFSPPLRGGVAARSRKAAKHR